MGFSFNGNEVILPKDTSSFRTKKELRFELLRYFRKADPEFIQSEIYSYQDLFNWAYSDSKYKPELWAWYGAYDHIALCQLFGRMIDLPNQMPQCTHELKSVLKLLNNPKMPKQPQGKHNALADAKWNMERIRVLRTIIKEKSISI